MEHLIAGVDEVGRGPLAGPVVAAAVILNPQHPIEGLADSKLLTPRRREKLAREIREYALAWALGRAEVGEIDSINILQASLLAMTRAVEALLLRPHEVQVDGNRCPRVPYPVIAIVGGDASVPAISAASIIAKVSRDTEMLEMDVLYPQYGFARHKGYPTAEHIAAMRQHGVCPTHRRSFAPVRNCLEQSRLSTDG